jgi:hypothetical protein
MYANMKFSSISRGLPRFGEGVVATASTGTEALALRCLSLVETAGLVDGLNRKGRK